MEDLPDLIRQIRKDLRLSQSALAKSLGVDQTAVSQYENDRVTPSIEVLIRLHGVPKNRKTQETIRKHIAIRLGTVSDHRLSELVAGIEPSAQGSPDLAVLNSALQWLTDKVIQRKAKPRLFLSEVRKLIESGVDIPPMLSEFVRLYRQHGRSPKVKELFLRALGYIELEISQIGPHDQEQKNEGQ